MADWLETEVLIIGSGIAGSAAALRLAEAGVPVTVVTRASEPQESNTYRAPVWERTSWTRIDNE